MQFIKTICVVTVLGALAYGAYTTLTGSPPQEPPLEAVNWDSPPEVDLPGSGPPPLLSGPPSAPATGGAPKYSAGSSNGPTNIVPGAARISPGGPVGASITNVRPLNTDVPSSYPSTNIAPGPLDASPVQLAAVSSPNPGGISPSTATAATSAGGLSPVPQVVQAGAPATSGGGPALTTPTGVVPQSFTTPVAGAGGAVGFPAAAGSTSPSPSPSLAQSMEKVQTLLNQNKLSDALDQLSRWFDHPTLSAEERQRVQGMLDQLAGSVIYSREHLLEPPHTVAQGETLKSIAERYQVPLELLVKINGIADPLYLPAGTQLKVLKGPFDLLIDRSRRQLTLFLDGIYAGSFPLAFGRDLTLPDGNYMVQAKQANPTFQAADGVIAAGDPNNPLGARWIDLGNGQGIHGTNDPSSLASDGGRGFLRLAPRDIDDLYDIVSVGSKVMIRP